MFDPLVVHWLLMNGALFCKITPLKFKFPPTERPPANVDVEVLVTARLVRVVVPALRVDERLRVPAESAPRFAVCAKRFVEEAVVEKRFVVVAFVATGETADKTPRVAEEE